MYIIYLTEIALEATCLTGEPAEQCIDGLAECSDESGFKCLCTSANYKSGSICKVSKFDNKLCILYLKITFRTCRSYHAFLDRGLLLSKNLLTTGFY